MKGNNLISIENPRVIRAVSMMKKRDGGNEMQKESKGERGEVGGGEGEYCGRRLFLCCRSCGRKKIDRRRD